MIRRFKVENVPEKKPMGKLILGCVFILTLIGVVIYNLGIINVESAADEVSYVEAVADLSPQDEIEAIEPEPIEIEEPEPAEPEADSAEPIEEISQSETIAEPAYRPMTVERQDNSYGPEIGRITIDSVGLDLEIIQGAGSNDQSAFARLFYAVADKIDAELGVDNFVLASHSISTDVNAGFSPILVYQDGSFNPHRALDIDQLLLQVGDLITIFLDSTQRYYIFEVALIEGDVSPSFYRLVELLADIEGRPQLTLYSCSAVDDNPDGRIVVQAEFISASSADYIQIEFMYPRYIR